MSTTMKRRARATGNGKKTTKGGSKPPIIPVKSRHDGKSDGRRAAKPGPGTVPSESAPREAEVSSRAKRPTTKVDRKTLEREFEESYDAFVSSFRTSLQHARRMGERLLGMKKALGHGHFTHWLEGFCRRKGTSPSTLRSYMQVAKRGHDLFKEDDPNLQSAGDLNLTEALELLKQPKPSSGGDDAPRAADARDPDSAGPHKPDNEARTAPEPDHDTRPRPGSERADLQRRPPSEPPAAPTASPTVAPAGEIDPDGDAGHEAESQALSGDPGPRDELSDERYLAALPIRAQLAEHGKSKAFDAQALLYKHLHPAIAPLLRRHRPDPQDVRIAAIQIGPSRLYSIRIAAALATAPPARWTVCTLCEGRGVDAYAGGTCSDCGGQGFEIGFLDGDVENDDDGAPTGGAGD